MDEQTDILKVSPDHDELHHFHLVEQVDPNTFSDDETRWLWEVVKTQDYAFDDLSRNNAAYFCMVLLAPQCAHFLVRDGDKRVGWCLVRGLYEQSNPEIHFVLWEKFSAQQAKAAAKEIIDWLFRVWRCHRVTATVPEYNEQAKRLATLLRFQFEGCMKEAILFHERWRHVNMYGLLKEEFYRVIH